jgi:hypothetical protein
VGVLEVIEEGKSRTTEWDPKDEVETERVKSEFNSMVAEGRLAYTEKKGEKVATRTFDPEAESIRVHRRLVGG